MKLTFHILPLLLLSSCVTYTLPEHSMLEQFAQTKKEKKVTFIIAVPLIFPGIVTGNSLTQIKVLDKDSNEHIIPVTFRTSVRITKKNGKRTSFYFNTLLIEDSTITGKKDHFAGINIRPINLNDIQKIEVQK